MRGKKFSLYVNSKTMDAFAELERIAERDGISVSDLICNGIRDAVLQETYRVSITKEAYEVLGDGQADRLVSVPAGGRMLWTAKN